MDTESMLDRLELPEGWTGEVSGTNGNVIKTFANVDRADFSNPIGVDIVFTAEDFQSVLAVGPNVSTHFADTENCATAVKEGQKAIDAINRGLLRD